MNAINAIICFGVSLVFMVGCNEDPNRHETMVKLFQQEKDLKCQLESMQDSIRREWDSLSSMMERELPADMPLEEKNNMLKVRNADLIRMFESFATLNDTVKVAVKATEMKDKAMISRIAAVRQNAEAIETQKIALFEAISKEEGEAALANYKSIYSETIKKPCNH